MSTLRRVLWRIVRLPFCVALWVLWTPIGLFFVFMWHSIFRRWSSSLGSTPLTNAAHEQLESGIGRWFRGYAGIWDLVFGPGSAELA